MSLAARDADATLSGLKRIVWLGPPTRNRVGGEQTSSFDGRLFRGLGDHHQPGNDLCGKVAQAKNPALRRGLAKGGAEPMESARGHARTRFGEGRTRGDLPARCWKQEVRFICVHRLSLPIWLGRLLNAVISCVTIKLHFDGYSVSDSGNLSNRILQVTFGYGKSQSCA